MSNKKKRPERGLGRGLGSLIPTAPPEGEYGVASTGPVASSVAAAVSENGRTPAPTSDNELEESSQGPELVAVDGAWFTELDPQRITPNRVQPRQVFDEEAMAELVHSVREIGLLQPIVVRPLGEDYELIMGERRWRAAQEAGLATIPAIVRATDDADMLRDALLENLHRSNLNPLEEASAYQQLLEDFDCTHEELAERIGRSRPQISNTLRLLKLSPEVQRRVAAGVLSAGHARALLGAADAATQDRLAQRVVAEGISVRGLEELVSLGESGDDATPRRSFAKPSAPGLSHISDRLADRLDTRVKVSLGKSKGKVAIEFATLEDLQRIVDLIDPRNREDRPI